MAKLIGSAQSTNFGENLFIRKAQEFLDDQYIIYWNRQIYGREFDVCILMPGKGILVVELKGWREENILRIENSDTIIIKTNEGETLATPQKQARGYRFAIERHIRQNTERQSKASSTLILMRRRWHSLPRPLRALKIPLIVLLP